MRAGPVLMGLLLLKMKIPKLVMALAMALVMALVVELVVRLSSPGGVSCRVLTAG